MKIWKRARKVLSAACCLAMVLSLIPVVGAAESGPVKSNNKNRQDYWSFDQRYTGSYLYENTFGGLTRLEYISGEPVLKYDSRNNGYWTYPDGKIIVEDYNTSFQFVSGRTVPQELDCCYGFLSGKDYNFLVFGRTNKAHDNALEVIRVVKYSKNWDRLDQLSISDIKSQEAFGATSARLAEANGSLYIHASQTTYNGHQSCMLLQIKESDMTLTDYIGGAGSFEEGISSHSMNQYILIDQENRVVTLDHGDVFPRAAVLYRYKVEAGPEKLSSISGQLCDGSMVQKWANITEASGNRTGAAVTGLAETTNGYITAFNYDGVSKTDDRSVYLGYTTKDSLNSTVRKLSGAGTTAPVLAPTSPNGGYILWNEQKQILDEWGYPDHAVSDTLYYATYSDGGLVGAVQTAKGFLSDCQPILYNGKVVWYVTDNSAPVFYGLDSSGISVLGGEDISKPTTPTDPTAPTNPTTPTDPGQPTTPDQPSSTSAANVMLAPRTFSMSTALKNDGTLWGWGAANYIMKSSIPYDEAAYSAPVQIANDFISAGDKWGIKADGSLWLWGPASMVTGNYEDENTVMTEPMRVMENVMSVSLAESADICNLALKKEPCGYGALAIKSGWISMAVFLLPLP